MMNRIFFLILVTLFWDWKRAFIAAQECEDDLSYCDQLESFCDHEVHSQFTRANCKKTCKRCPKDLDPNGLCENNGGCEHTCEVDEDDKTIKICKCYTGYRLKENGLECEDIDECQNDICVTGKFCSNTPGGFSCDEARCDGKGRQAYAGRAECCEKLPQDSECGIVQGGTRQQRIVGGNDSYPGQWPWQVLIMINKNTLCGGTLLSKEWVVTAGHCFKDFVEGTTKFELYFGVNDMGKLTQNKVQKRLMKRKFTYPGWDQERFEINDIALIQLDSPVRINRWVKTVCLPNGESPKVGTKCFAAGWGLTEEGNTSPSATLQFVDLPIVDRPKCENNYKDEEVKVNRTFMMCAGYDEGGKDSCRGDSGGPLVCQRCDSCGWYLSGVVSFGSGCARAGLFGVYADVQYYEEWISQITSIPVTKGPRCTGPAFTAWSNWSECTKTCGSGGTRTRKRECVHKGRPSDGCTGDVNQSGACPERKCPRFGAWGGWSDCSKSCGGGSRTQIRRCVNGEIGDAGCPRDKATRSEECKTKKCPEWDNWSKWSKCSKTCGGGETERTRRCLNGKPSDLGCEGGTSQTDSCNTQVCPGWSDWGPWGKCSVTCGGGEQTSTRTCSGGKCPGSDSRKQPCNTQPCPVFGKWGKWEPCSVTCGGGKQFRARPCENGKLGDVGCEKGKESQSKDCATNKCPKFSSWSAWGKCSVTCGGGEQTSSRTCENGEVGDDGCKGETRKTRSCATDECLGKLGPWNQWSTCSSTCGEGTRKKDRPCIGGTKCTGEREASESCKIKNCPVFGDWAKWGDCSESCGGGRRSRTRECLYTDNPNDCEGEPRETEACNDDICPGKWTRWTPWSKCDVTCGEGNIKRSRECEGGLVGNPGCDDGPAEELKICREKPCPSKWGRWGSWSECSKTCDRGLQTRERPCEGAEPGKGGCVPASAGKQEKNCNEIICSACDNWNDAYCNANYPSPDRCFDITGQTYCRKNCGLCPGLYEHWNQWSSCTSTCGPGWRERTRDCKHDSGCDGERNEVARCQASCKGFGPWSDWSKCSVSCNGGKRTRTRTCPFDTCEPDENGSSSLTEEGVCNEDACPGKWGRWGAWGQCSATCGEDGEQQQTRECQGGRPGGPGCPGSDTNSRPCQGLPQCPGKWTEWSDWSECSATCGNGQQEKTRRCENGVVGQPDCLGKARDTRDCDAGECVVARWGNWGDWGSCSDECMRSRTRNCIAGKPGDRGCQGEGSETEACDQSQCQDTPCAQLRDDSQFCGGVNIQYCAIENVKASCRKTCCEACKDNPAYSHICPTAQCSDPIWISFVQVNCPRSCGLC